ncbi:hypothetical protein [Thermomonospora umbrina]|uniref:hypothetical protein n=1 Tax=Thermomonospora umbrina TaxID=111806 RepID=UPI000E23D413|nr:hypothetical protein [Thermomonospora umbrina]
MCASPHWNTPPRIRERSARPLTGPGRLEAIAAELRAAVRPALNLAHPDPEAVRLTALADQIAAPPGRGCAGPGCTVELDHAGVSSRRRYCGDACRQRAHRARTTKITPA